MKNHEDDKKNESFNIIKSREKESVAKKVKEAMNVREKPLGRDEKPRLSKRECPLLFEALYYVKNGSFPCTKMVFFLKERPFLYSLPYKLSTLFSNVFSWFLP